MIAGTLLAVGPGLGCANHTTGVVGTGRDAGSAGADGGRGVYVLGEMSELPPPPPRPTSAARLRAPLSHTFVSQGYPRLQWFLPDDAQGAQVEVCRDRACTMLEQRLEAPGSELTLSERLEAGVHFWRVRARRGGALDAQTSATWEFVSPPRDAPRLWSGGNFADINGDGYLDYVASVDGNVMVAVYGTSTGIAEARVERHRSQHLGSAGPVMVNAAPVGDVNGDGFSDVLVGNVEDDEADARHHPAQYELYLGSDSGLHASTARFRGRTFNTPHFGISVVGDINDDGFQDVFVADNELVYAADRQFNPNVTESYILFGGPEGFNPRHAQRIPRPSGAARTYGGRATTIPDINGDGRQEIVLLDTTILGSGEHRFSLWLSPHALPFSAAERSFTWSGRGNAVMDLDLSLCDVDGDGRGDVVFPEGALTREESVGIGYFPASHLLQDPLVPSVRSDVPGAYGGDFVNLGGLDVQCLASYWMDGLEPVVHIGRDIMAAALDASGEFVWRRVYGSDRNFLFGDYCPRLHAGNFGLFAGIVAAIPGDRIAVRDSRFQMASEFSTSPSRSLWLLSCR